MLLSILFSGGSLAELESHYFSVRLMASKSL